MIVTRYWLGPENSARIEKIEWQTAHPLATSVVLTLPEVAEVEDMIDPSTEVRWVGLSQAAFDGQLDQGIDPYTLPLSADVTIVDKATWDQAVLDAEAAAEQARAEHRARLAAAEAERQAALAVLAENSGLSPDQVSALFGGS
jgi:regulator of protease activity HflC (stomatin/prohibitin superfamily)